MASVTHRLKRLEEKRRLGLSIVIVDRDDDGQFRVVAGGRSWTAEPCEGEYAFASRVQAAVGAPWLGNV